MISTEKPLSIHSTLRLLEQAEELLSGLSHNRYKAEAPPAFPSSVGAHTRHILDHYDSFLNGLERGFLDYHSRERDAETERNPDFAITRIQDLCSRFLEFNETLAETPTRLVLRVSAEDPSETVATNPERELYFCQSHTIHHFAMIGMICRHLGHSLPEDFGLAPSTIAHRLILTKSNQYAS